MFIYSDDDSLKKREKCEKDDKCKTINFMNPINFNYRMMLIMLIVWTIWYFHKSNRTKSKAPERLWRNLGSFKFPVTKRNIWCKIPVLLEVTPHTNLQVLKVTPHISLQVGITNKPSCSGNWIECHEITIAFLKIIPVRHWK